MLERLCYHIFMATPKRPRDANKLAKNIVGLSVGDDVDADPDYGKNPAAVTLGRLGGLKGGKARAQKLSKKRRSEIAKKAAETRWAARASNPKNE